jgi:hypothetical protein
MHVGQKVKYIGTSDEQVRWGSNDDPRGRLHVGEVYTVSMVEVHTYHTKIDLEGWPGKRFNSCFLEPIKD